MDGDSKKKKDKQKKPSSFEFWWKWPLIVLFIAFILSFSFGVLSEFALSGAGIIISIIVIIIFIVISIISDMVGVAITAASVEPFRAMASRKVRGSKEAIKLIKNAEKVASIAADVVGDICGILSGAAGATVALAIITYSSSSILEVIVASLVSAIIASLTIFGKAFCKKYSILHSEKIILILGKFISLFHFQKKRTKINSKTEKKLEISEKYQPKTKQNTKSNKIENFEEKKFTPDTF